MASEQIRTAIAQSRSVGAEVLTSRSEGCWTASPDPRSYHLGMGAREYLSDLRQAVGDLPLIVAGACVIIRDEEGRVLMQRRCDDGSWDLIGGSMEPGETFEQTVRREAREEIGVELGALEVFEVYSGPDFFHRYPNGDQVYHVGVAFQTRDFRGTPEPDNDEVDQVRFFSIDGLPAHVKRSAMLHLEHLTRKQA